jgi:hypothetical protein
MHCAFAPVGSVRPPRSFIAPLVLIGLGWMVRRRSVRGARAR